MVLEYNVVSLISTFEQHAKTPKTENKVMMIFGSCVIRVTAYWNYIGTLYQMVSILPKSGVGSLHKVIPILV